MWYTWWFSIERLLEVGKLTRKCRVATHRPCRALTDEEEEYVCTFFDALKEQHPKSEALHFLPIFFCTGARAPAFPRALALRCAGFAENRTLSNRVCAAGAHSKGGACALLFSEARASCAGSAGHRRVGAALWQAVGCLSGLRARLDTFLQPRLRKGIPALFSVVKPLYYIEGRAAVLDELLRASPLRCENPMRVKQVLYLCFVCFTMF